MKTFLLIFFAALSLDAATYWVDFENGDDSNAGTSTNAPWKRCKGDAAATGTAASTSLSSGDTVNFKGGVVYKGQISLTVNGTSGAYVTYEGDSAVHGWGTGKAVISGETNLTFSVCTGQGTNATQVNNTNFASIYYASTPANWDFGVIAFEDGDTMLRRAGSQNTNNWFAFEDTTYFNTVASGLTTTTLTDSSALNQSDADYWKGARIIVHVAGNNISISTVTNFSPSTDTVTFPATSAPLLAGGVYRYSLMNAQPQLVRGSYVVDEAGDRILVWPTNSISNVTVSARSYAFNTSGASYNRIRGFKIRGQWGPGYEAGRMITGSTSTPTDGLIIERNELFASFDNGATAAVYTYGAGTSNNVIRQNIVSRIYGRGLFGSTRVIIQSNELSYVTGTVLYSQNPTGARNEDIQYLDNYIHDCQGVHANGMTVYGGTGSSNYYATNIVIARNRVIRQWHPYGPFAISLQAWQGGRIENNILDGDIADDGCAHAPILYWLNNTITGTLRIFYASNAVDCQVKNNVILNGMMNNTGEDWADIDRANNIYTNLTFRQAVGYGWTMETGGVVTNITAIYSGGFTDGTITTNSAAYNTGTDTRSLMVSALDAARAAWDLPMDVGGYQATGGGGGGGGGGPVPFTQRTAVGRFIISGRSN